MLELNVVLDSLRNTGQGLLQLSSRDNRGAICWPVVELRGVAVMEDDREWLFCTHRAQCGRVDVRDGSREQCDQNAAVVNQKCTFSDPNTRQEGTRSRVRWHTGQSQSESVAEKGIKDKCKVRDGLATVVQPPRHPHECPSTWSAPHKASRQHNMHTSPMFNTCRHTALEHTCTVCTTVGLDAPPGAHSVVLGLSMPAALTKLALGASAATRGSMAALVTNHQQHVCYWCCTVRLTSSANQRST